MPTQWADSGGRAETYFSSISNQLQPTNLLLDAMSCHFEDLKVADVSFFFRWKSTGKGKILQRIQSG